MAPNCPTLSTLILSYCGLTMIPGSFFQYMNNLQVLDLSYNSELMDLLSSISNLESLSALSLRGCGRLKSVPPLGKLKNLRVLDVFQTGIKEVPQGMENLVKLKFLDMGGIDLDDLASLELLEEFRGGFCDLHSFHKFTSSHHNYVKDWWYNIFVGPPVSDFLLGGGFDDRIPKQRRVNYRTLHH
ncbi:hypothetical protein P3S67_004482 [Capsicum chacoense]